MFARVSINWTPHCWDHFGLHCAVIGVVGAFLAGLAAWFVMRWRDKRQAVKHEADAEQRLLAWVHDGWEYLQLVSADAGGVLTMDNVRTAFNPYHEGERERRLHEWSASNDRRSPLDDSASD